MGILEDLKKKAKKYDIPQGSEEAQALTKIINSLFYLPKKPTAEAVFVEQVATRGLGTQERTGLHASSLTVSDDKFCLRAQILAIFFKQDGNKDLPPNLIRIFEEGNSVHEKWQRLFLRAGFSKYDELDKTCFNEEFGVYFSPDIICRIPDFAGDELLIGEIKSMNSHAFDAQAKHPTAWLQLQFYMFLTGIRKGFVLCENKNTQAFRVEYYEYDEEKINFIIRRLLKIQRYKRVLERDKRIVCRPKDANGVNCKRCESCFMRSACWKISERIRY